MPSPADRHPALPIFGIGLLAGPANVVMQLSHPAVGHGVAESRVESGQLFRHPLKRARTTLTYLGVALLGSDADRAAYRRAVNRSHAQVHSRPGDPVAYDAFDRDLQLWVAACLYVGIVDIGRRLGAEAADDEAAYRAGAVLGTTLQVRPEQWPADRVAFDAYWRRGLSDVTIDDAVRTYLDTMVTARYLPWPWPSLLGGAQRWVTTGLLPPPIREAMGYAWTEADERRLNRLLAGAGLAVRHLPGPVQRFPFNALLWDVRLRSRLGLPLV